MNAVGGVIFTTFLMLAFQAVQTAASFDLLAMLDKYGYPTVVSCVAFLYFSRLTKKQSEERNELIERNNDLVERVIDVLKDRRVCKYDSATYSNKKF